MIDICAAKFDIKKSTVEYWTKELWNVRNLTVAWLKKDEEIYKELLQWMKYGVYSTTPNSGNSYNVRNVNTDGSLNNNNAYNGNNGVRPDCEKS